MKRFYLAVAALLLGLSASAQFSGKAKWITASECQSVTNTWLSYRKDFTVDKCPDSLIANIAADTKYWLWINGEMAVFEGGLKRGPSPHATYYDKVDIAPFLKEGDNTIAILLWHFGKQGFSHISSGLAALKFEAVSGNLEICSDKTWRCMVNAAYESTRTPNPNFRLPESNVRFDARKNADGWNMTGYSKPIPRARVIDEVGRALMGTLVERPIPQWKVSGINEYVSVSRQGDSLVCKLPYDAQITPWLSVEAAGDETIHIQTDHYLGGSEPNVRAEYVTVPGVQEYESLGWMNGHNVLYIVPESVKVKAVGYRESGYDTDICGSFSCEDSVLNELWKRSARSLYVCMRDSFMDCPDRERALWWGDGCNELCEAFYALSPSSSSLTVKGIRELVSWQAADGVLYSPIPSGNWSTMELPLQMLTAIGWYGFYTYYYFSGDSSFVAEVYPAVRRYLHDCNLWSFSECGLVNVREGEWNWGDWGPYIDIEALTNCWYYLALKAEKEFALMLGKEADARQAEDMMSKISDNFDKTFWTGTSYRSPSLDWTASDDRVQAMAVLSGLAPDSRYPALREVLRNEMYASPYMERYILEAMIRMGDPDGSFNRMKSRFAGVLSHKELTTMFEGWGIGNKGFGGGSVNHGGCGSPLIALSRCVCGIEPTSPGFSTFSVTPCLGRLKNVSASVETSYGTISLSMSRKTSRSSVAAMEIEIPQGTEATVRISSRKFRTLPAGKHSLKIYVGEPSVFREFENPSEQGREL